MPRYQHSPTYLPPAGYPSEGRRGPNPSRAYVGAASKWPRCTRYLDPHPAPWFHGRMDLDMHTLLLQGRTAYMAGEGEEDCPYPPGSWPACAWELGFDEQAEITNLDRI